MGLPVTITTSEENHAGSLKPLPQSMCSLMHVHIFMSLRSFLISNSFSIDRKVFVSQLPNSQLQ